MSTTHHDPHAFGAPLTAAEINAPLGQLDAAISAISPVLDITDAAFGASVASADNVVAIQAALDYQKANGGIVYIPQGTFLTSPLTYAATTTQALHMLGGGRDRSILKPKAGTGTVLTLSGPLSGNTYRDFQIDGTGGTAHGLYYSGTADPDWLYSSAFENLKFINCALEGLYIKNSFANRYVNIWAGGNGSDQIKVWGAGRTDHYERIDIGSTVAGKGGLRVIDGGTFVDCNGIYDTATAAGPMFKLGGDGTADSDSLTRYPAVRFTGSSVEAFGGTDKTGILFVNSPTAPILMDGVLFQTGNNVANCRAVDLLNSNVDTPLIMRGCRFTLVGTATWANGLPIHGALPLVTEAGDNGPGEGAIWDDGDGGPYTAVQRRFGVWNANASGYFWNKNRLMGFTDLEYLASYRMGDINLGSDYVDHTGSAAMPTSGTFRRGDFVHNTNHSIAEAGGAGVKYTLAGWRRLTDGSAHVLNTDWVERRELTGN